MEINLMVLFVITWFFIIWNFFWLDKRIRFLWGTIKLMRELVDSISYQNSKILNAIPDAKKNLDNTQTILDLAKKQQAQIAVIRRDWLQANMLLEEVLEVASMAGGKSKPDEALKYLRLAKKKIGSEFGKAMPGVTVDIHDSHTDNDHGDL